MVIVPETRPVQPEHVVDAVASWVTCEDPVREIDDSEDVRSWPTWRPEATMLFFAVTSPFTVHVPLWLTDAAYTDPWTVAELLQLHTPPV